MNQSMNNTATYKSKSNKVKIKRQQHQKHKGEREDALVLKHEALLNSVHGSIRKGVSHGEALGLEEGRENLKGKREDGNVREKERDEAVFKK